MDEVDVIHDFTDPKTGIALEWQESFGREQEIKLPTKKGVYHLQAELIPAALNTEQEESLLKHHMSIVRKACKAHDAVITLK